jgi:hypothetical protein
MPLTTNTSSDTSRVEARGLMAISWLSTIMTTNTAGVENAVRRVLLEGSPSAICPYVQNAEEQHTSNTVLVARCAWGQHTDIGLGSFQRRRVVTGGAALPRSFRARDAIFELRRLTGLTWEELAGLLSVTRRSLHLWANGGPINAPNEKHVRDLLITMQKLDRGTAQENRGLLLAPLPGGGIVSDLLRTQQFENAIAQAGRGQGRVAFAQASAVVKPAKLSLADMLGARSDKLHTDEGVALPPRRGPRRV